MDAESIIAAVQAELQKHRWDYFVVDPPAIADGGKGVVVPGCPTCSKRTNTVGQFLDHISLDVIPGVIETAMAGRQPGDEP